jgi:hypothetical protein
VYSFVGRKGSPTVNTHIDCDIIVSEVREKSRKPDEIYGIAERLSPGARKIGMLLGSLILLLEFLSYLISEFLFLRNIRTNPQSAEWLADRWKSTSWNTLA